MDEFSISMDEEQLKKQLEEENKENLIEDPNIPIRDLNEDFVIPGQKSKKGTKNGKKNPISFEEKMPLIQSSKIMTLSDQKLAADKQNKKKQIHIDIIDPHPERTKKEEKKEKKKARRQLKSFDKQTNYKDLGVAFDMDHTQVNLIDSSYMRKVKEALAAYLDIRKAVFENHNFSEISAQKMLDEDGLYSRTLNTKNQEDLISSLHYDSRDALSVEEREIMGNAMDKVLGCVDSFLYSTGKYLNVKRGRARYRQVEKLKEKLFQDDFRFYLSRRKRETRQNLDNSYRVYDGKHKDFVDRFVNGVMPTWQRAMYWEDMVKMERYAYREKRREERANGELPGYCWRTLEWIGAFCKIRGYKLAMHYNELGAFVDRGLGAATMIAANTLELGGKIIKAPLKILSCLFNGTSKLFGSKKRWKMKYSLRDNWKSLDDGRKIFRRYLKGACVVPTAILETLTRGIPTLFGHKFRSGVYKRTSKWTNDILRDGKAVLRSIGIQDKALYRRMERDEATAGRLSYNANINDYEIDQKEDEADELFDEEMAALDGDRELIRPVAQQEQPVAQQEQPIVQQEQPALQQEQPVEQNEQGQQHFSERSTMFEEEQPVVQQVEQPALQQEQQVEQPVVQQEQQVEQEDVVREFRLAGDIQSRLFTKKEEALVKTEDLAKLTTAQLEQLKELCVNTLSEQTGKKKEEFSLYPLDQLQELAKQANEDYPDQALLKSHVESGLKEIEKLLSEENMGDLLNEISHTEEELKDLPESAGFAMKEYALLSLHRNPAVKLSEDQALSDLSPSKLVELSKNALFFTKYYEEGQDEETLEKLRDAAVSILVLTTDLPETKFMMRPMEELNTLVTKALSGLDDRKTLSKETLDFLEKIPEFDVETEILNDREVELLNRDRAELTGAELLKQKNVAERVLSKKAGQDKAELDFLPMEFKLSLARSVWESKDSEDEIAWEVSYKIDQYLKAEDLNDQMNRIDETRILQDEHEAVLAAKRDEFAFGLAKAGFTDGFTRRDLDRVPIKELQEASSFALMIAKTSYAELDQNERKDYRDALCMFLKNQAGLDPKELSLLPTNMLTSYARQLITNIANKDANAPMPPLLEDYVQQRIEMLAKEFFGETDFDRLSTREARLELKELIAYRICKETKADREKMMQLDAASLYTLYTESEWKTAENVTGLADMQKYQTWSLNMTAPGVAQVKKLSTEWSSDAANLLGFLSDLTSGIGATDQNGAALSKEIRVVEIFRKNTELIAELEKGKKNLFKEIINNVSEEEAVLFEGLQKVIDSLLADLSKQKENNENLKEKGWNAETVEALLKAKEGEALFQDVDDRILAIIEDDGKKVQKLIGDATKDIFVDREKADQEKKEEENVIHKKENDEEFNDQMPSLFELDQYDKERIRSDRNNQKEVLGEEEEEAEDVKKLHRLRDDAYGKNSVQGRYLQASLSGYYEKSSTQSKRLIISELLRNIKPAVGQTTSTGTKKSGNPLYLKAVLKGAGPVLQKLVQGIPENLIKPGFRRAIQIAKSELRHLPEEYVKAKLDEIAKGAKKPVKSLTKLSNLGAASVAETFLCRVEYADGTKEQVVVKLLRPDAEERMQEETGILTSIAKETDQTGVMEGSILSHIKEIQKEFDFRTESANTEKGKAYETTSVKKGTVKSVRVNENFETKKDAFVMDKAEGECCDRYLARIKEEIEADLDILKNRGEGDPEMLVLTAENAHIWMGVKNDLIEKLKRLEARKKHVVKLSEKWVQEALYGNLFHHGDLHSGNLMIDDNGITVLDYGNANVFTEEQVSLIVRMMASAMGQNAELFITNLEELINLGKKEKTVISKEQRDALTESLNGVFSLGDAENAGERIFVALQKAEEAGIRLPHEIQNFSRCEQRLENTINEFNDTMAELKRAIKKVELAKVEFTQIYLDPVMNYQQAKMDKRLYGAEDPIAKHIGDYKKLDEATLKDLLNKKNREKFEKTYFERIEEANIKLNYESVSATIKELPKRVDQIRKTVMNAMQIEDDLMRASKTADISEMIDKLIKDLNAPEFLSSEIANKLNRAVITRNPDKVEPLLERFKEVEWVIRLKKEYKAFQGLFGTKEKKLDIFIKDFIDYSEHAREEQRALSDLRFMIARDLDTDIDPFALLGAVINSVQSSPEVLEKDENGNYLNGEPAKELDEVLKKAVQIQKKGKNYKKTPEEEETEKDLRRLKFYVMELDRIRRKDPEIRKQLSKVFDDGTEFGKSLKKKYEAYRKLQDKHLQLRGAKNRDEKAILEVGKERKKAMDAFLTQYREYLTRELEKLHASEKKAPETEEINFADIMEERVRKNPVKTVGYLGGITKIGQYKKGDMKIELTEEQKKLLEESAK